MLKRGYIILLAGGVLSVAGIVTSALWAGSFAGEFLQENTIINRTLVMPSESLNATLPVNDISRPISLALRFEPESANVILEETVIDPRGRVVNTDEILNEFFTTFRVNSVGDFTLTISNKGPDSVSVSGIFGYIPVVGENNQVDLSLLNALLIGFIIFIMGIIALVVGIIFVIIDRRRDSRRPPRLTR